MEFHNGPLEGILILEPEVFSDGRGHFMETYHRERYERAGIAVAFVQDNVSFSVQGTLRGLHYQHPRGQAKLVHVVMGEIFDVAVDIRWGSPNFGKWTGIILSEKNRRQAFIPEGFAHGFCVTSEKAVVTYKCSDFYTPDCEGGILWSDPDLGIVWPVREPILSPKDRANPLLREVPAERLPTDLST